jgi:hypothetical protein
LMVPVLLLAGIASARAMLAGKAAVRAEVESSCRNVRRSVAMGRASLRDEVDCEVRLAGGCCWNVTVE